jgi:alpha-glucosidase
VLAFRRTGAGGGESLTCVVNLGSDPIDIGRYGEPVVGSAELDRSLLPIDSAVWLR